MSDNAGSRASVWDTLAAMKERHSTAEKNIEREKESARLRKAAVESLEDAFTAAARENEMDGARVISDILRADRRDPAVVAMLADQGKVLGEAGREGREKEMAEIVTMQRRACRDLETARRVLSRVADEREAAASRAGRLEYKVRE